MEHLKTFEAFSLNPKNWFKKKQKEELPQEMEVLADTDDKKKKDVDLSSIKDEVSDYIYGLADLANDKYTSLTLADCISYCFYMDKDTDVKEEIEEFKSRIEGLDENLSFNVVSQVKRQYQGENEDMLVVLVVVSNGINNIKSIFKQHLSMAISEQGLSFEDPYRNMKRRRPEQ